MKKAKKVKFKTPQAWTTGELPQPLAEQMRVLAILTGNRPSDAPRRLDCWPWVSIERQNELVEIRRRLALVETIVQVVRAREKEDK